MANRVNRAAGASRNRVPARSQPRNRKTVQAQKRQRQARPRVSLKLRLKTLFARSVLLVETVVAIGLVVAVVVFWQFSRDLSKLEMVVDDIKPPVATTIWSDGGVLLATPRVENRQPIALKDI